MIKQNLDLNPAAKNNVANKVLITIFSMLAELERDFISERTKEGLKARQAKGIKLIIEFIKNKLYYIMPKITSHGRIYANYHY